MLAGPESTRKVLKTVAERGVMTPEELAHVRRGFEVMTCVEKHVVSLYKQRLENFLAAREAATQ